MNEPTERVLRARTMGCKNFVCYCPFYHQINCQDSARIHQFNSQIYILLLSRKSTYAFFMGVDGKHIGRGDVIGIIIFAYTVELLFIYVITIINRFIVYIFNVPPVFRIMLIFLYQLDKSRTSKHEKNSFFYC